MYTYTPPTRTISSRAALAPPSVSGAAGSAWRSSQTGSTHVLPCSTPQHIHQIGCQ